MSVIDKIQINSTTYDVAAGAGNVAYSDAATYPDGSAGKEISQLKSEITDLDTLFPVAHLTFPAQSDLVQGGFNTSGGNYNSNTRVRTNDFYPCDERLALVLSTDTGLKWTFAFYTSAAASSYISSVGFTTDSVVYPPHTAKYYRIALAKSDDSTIAPSGVSTLKVGIKDYMRVIAGLQSDDARNTNIANMVSNDGDIYADFNRLEQGSFGTTGQIYSSTTRVRNARYFPIMEYRAMTIVANGGTGYKFSLIFYATNQNNPNKIADTGGFVACGTYAEIPHGAKYIRFALAKSDDTTLAPSDITSLTYSVYTINCNVNDLNAVAIVKDSYSVDARLKKEPVSVASLGALTYAQSFCIYDGKYYSTDGSHIGRQAANFDTETSVDISVGHGNTMQIGLAHPEYIYISGCTDQKIYVVNLSDLTLADTITLPTTGYTTCAVDDVNQVAYILQYDTAVSSKVFYNFMAYDYANEQILFARKVPRACGCVQAVCYHEGRIYANFGAGSDALPNAHLVFNTNGDVIAEYVLPQISNKEPEGIAVYDGALYVSIYEGKAVYKVS